MGPTFETERLLIRPPTGDDLAGWTEFYADPGAMRLLGGPQPPEVAWRGLAAAMGSWELKGFGYFSILEKETASWVGYAGPWHPEGWPGPEVAGGFLTRAQLMGYGVEAASVIAEWVFEDLGWEHVVHCIDPRNAGAIRTVQRFGSRRIGPSGIGGASELYGQTREEFRAFARPLFKALGERGSLPWRQTS